MLPHVTLSVGSSDGSSLDVALDGSNTEINGLTIRNIAEASDSTAKIASDVQSLIFFDLSASALADTLRVVTAGIPSPASW